MLGRNYIMTRIYIIQKEAFDLSIFGLKSEQLIKEEIRKIKIVNLIQYMSVLLSLYSFLPFSGDEYKWQVSIYFIRTHINKNQQLWWTIFMYVSGVAALCPILSIQSIYIYNIGHLIFQYKFLSLFIDKMCQQVGGIHDEWYQRIVTLQLKHWVQIHIKTKR